MDAIAMDGRDLEVSSNGGDWRVGWYPPPDPPPGTPHGAAAVCVSGDRVVLVSSDGQRWVTVGDDRRAQRGPDLSPDVRRSRTLVRGPGRSARPMNRHGGLTLLTARPPRRGALRLTAELLTGAPPR